jgi:hypothetical protein
MPPPSEIKDFDPRFLRPCTFAVLRELGYGTRISINNGVGPGGDLATDMSMSMSVFADGGRRLVTTGEIERLAPGEITKISIDDRLAELREVPDDERVLCMLHMVPVDLLGTEAVDMPSKTMMGHVSASDDFIEYHQRPKGVVTGVAYQTGPLNDRRLSSTRSTVCQAPKVIVAEPVDTLMLLMNTSTSFDYDETVRMDFWILGAGGERIARSHVEVPPFSFRLVSTTEVLERAGKLEEYRAAGGVGMFLGYSKNGTVVPISLTRNKESGAIACDHTLPPVFYLSTWGGDARLQANARLEEEFFADVPAEEPAAAEALAR